ncbi:MAG: hypothetical protein RLN70_09570 [Rhodospirillaceae bacterium]
MLLHINGWAGAGKLPIARLMANQIDARVVDNHTIYNIGFSLTQFRSDEFYETVRAVRDIAFARILALDPVVPVIITNALGASSEWADENWAAIRELSAQRTCPLLAVTLRCAKEQHLERTTSAERSYLGKLRDRKQLEAMFDRGLLVPEGAHGEMQLDTTDMMPETAAQRILAWLTQSRLPASTRS